MGRSVSVVANLAFLRLRIVRQRGDGGEEVEQGFKRKLPCPTIGSTTDPSRWGQAARCAACGPAASHASGAISGPAAGVATRYLGGCGPHWRGNAAERSRQLLEKVLATRAAIKAQVKIWRQLGQDNEVLQVFDGRLKTKGRQTSRGEQL